MRRRGVVGESENGHTWCTLGDMTDQPRRFVAGDPIPFTPAELRDILDGAPSGAVITAALVNDALDRLRAADPEGKLPPHIQARIDAGQSADVAAAWGYREEWKP